MALGVLLIAAGSAQAQSDRSTGATSPFAANVLVDSTVAETPLAATERALVSTFKPKMKASLLPATLQGPEEDTGIGFGIEGMLTRTTFSGEDDFLDTGSAGGYGIGVWVGGNRVGRVGFVGEFLYVIRGDDDFKERILEIPAVFHINFGARRRDSVGGFITLGPVFSIKLKQELFGEELDDNFNGADIGILGGVGVEFFRVILEGRGNWGLRQIDKEGEFGNIKTRTFEFLAKFAFN